MDVKRFMFWRKWLTYANGLTAAVEVVVAGNSIFIELLNYYTKEIFINGNEFQSNILEFKNWLF